MIYVSQYFSGQEKNQVACATAEEAAKAIKEGNATAAKQWHWSLSEINFIRDDGTTLTIDEANQIRRACGVAEY